MISSSVSLSSSAACAIWMKAQCLEDATSFGTGPEAVRDMINHLGYVQIDTINVIERSHHHILYTRLPRYQRSDLHTAQSRERSIFEYWTHALAYISTSDFRYYLPRMQRYRESPHTFADVSLSDYTTLINRIRREGEMSIRDINDDVRIEKTHPWGSRKPSKRLLQLGFYTGDLTISKRTGMVKSYEITNRHFGWKKRPASPSESSLVQYVIRRALRSQGIVSIDSICYANKELKPVVLHAVKNMVKRKQLIPVHLEGKPKLQHWVEPATLDALPEQTSSHVHILSPFDPLVIQRKRLQAFFDYEHLFEAYVPAAKRVMGYFTLPVLVGDRIVAAIDLKMDRQADKLLIQQWTWTTKQSAPLKQAIEQALHSFERFQKNDA